MLRRKYIIVFRFMSSFDGNLAEGWTVAKTTFDIYTLIQ